MPQIPNPVPTVGVADQPLPKVSVNTPEAAFGGATAAALANLGHTIEGAGNELFNRAVSLKNDDNLAEAKVGDTQFMVEAGNLRAKYDSLKGSNAPQSYEEYQKNLLEARTRIRAGLSNPASRRLYDSSSLGTFGNAVANGAAHAAVENKRYQWEASTARIEAWKNQVYQMPDNRTFDTAMSGLEAEMKDRAVQAGWAKSTYDEELSKAKSEMALHRLRGLAWKDQDGANKLLDEYKASGLIQGRDIETAGKEIRALSETSGTDKISKEVLSKYLQNDGTYSKSPREMREEAVGIAKDRYKDNPKIEAATISNFDKNYTEHNYIENQEERDVRRQYQEFIVKGVGDIEQLPPGLVKRMNAKMKEDFDKDVRGHRNLVQAKTNDFQRRALLDMHDNDNAKFMDTNLLQVPGISITNYNFFKKLQREAMPDGDPRVKRAMGWITGYNKELLNDLQVTGPRKNETIAAQFGGALHDAIQAYQEANNKAPDEKAVTKEILPVVTRQITTEHLGGYWNTKSPPFFQEAVPEEYKRRYLKAQPLAEEREIHRDYNQQMFEHYFKTQKISKDQSRVGK